MTISLNLALAVALVTTALVITLLAAPIRRRMKHHNTLRLLAWASAALLVPANVVVVVSGAEGVWQVWLVVGSLAALATQFVLAFQGWIPVQQTSQPRRILAIGAHPDDLELAVGGTLARMADAGHEIHAMVMSDGVPTAGSGVRPGEAFRGAAYLGIEDTTVLGLPTDQLYEFEADMAHAVEAKIRALNPDIILTHSSHDRDPDHTATHRATLSAAREHPAILCYESPSATEQFKPSVFVDINEYVDTKSAAVEKHRSTRDGVWATTGGVAAAASARGSESRLRASAEAFEPVRVPAFRGVL